MILVYVIVLLCCTQVFVSRGHSELWQPMKNQMHAMDEAKIDPNTPINAMRATVPLRRTELSDESTFICWNDGYRLPSLSMRKRHTHSHSDECMNGISSNGRMQRKRWTNWGILLAVFICISLNFMTDSSCVCAMGRICLFVLYFKKAIRMEKHISQTENRSDMSNSIANTLLDDNVAFWWMKTTIGVSKLAIVASIKRPTI